jgi:hypothetical protein
MRTSSFSTHEKKRVLKKGVRELKTKIKAARCLESLADPTEWEEDQLSKLEVQRCISTGRRPTFQHRLSIVAVAVNVIRVELS